MPVQKLDHVNLRTDDLDGMVTFYERVMGLRKGRRPGFDFPGAWMYAGEQAVVHLVGTAARPADFRADQRLEHFALSATGLAEFLAHLRARTEIGRASCRERVWQYVYISVVAGS